MWLKVSMTCLLAWTRLVNCETICEYRGEVVIHQNDFPIQACDVIVNYNGIITNETAGLPNRKNNIDVTMLLKSLNCAKVKKDMYFGINTCQTNKLFIDDLTPERYLNFLDSGLDWVRRSDYDGVYLDLCYINNNKDQDIAQRILTRTQEFAASNGKKFAFSIFGKPTLLDLDQFQNSAAWITIGLKPLQVGSIPKIEYNEVMNINDIVNFWTGRNLSKLKMVYNLNLLFKIEETTVNAFLHNIKSYSSLEESNPRDYRRLISVFLNEMKTKLNNEGIKGVYLSPLDYDDINGYWSGNKMNFTKSFFQ